MSMRGLFYATLQLLEESLALIRSGPAQSPPPRRVLDMAQLEDRVLFSATPGVELLVAAEAEPDANSTTAETSDEFDLASEGSDASSMETSSGFILQWDDSESANGDSLSGELNGSSTDWPEGDGYLFDETSGDSLVEISDDGGLVVSDASYDSDDGSVLDASVADADVRHELVFVDTSADDYQQLVDDLLNSGGDRLFEVVLLDADRDGIEQISEALAGYDDLDAVHIVSHGTDQSVKLGSSWLSLDNVDAYAGQLVGWRDALATDADLLFYGCDFASNEDGQTLVESLSELTGADVAASTDETGNASRGGDWELEFHVGDIETTVAFSAELQQSWQGLLEASPVGGETLVNTTTTDKQELGDVAMDDSGNFVVVWVSDGQDGDSGKESNIYFQRYDAAGNPSGSETLVNTTTSGNQQDAAVAMDANGDFVVIWQGNGDQPGNVDDKGVYFQRFNSLGVAQGGETLVNTTTSNDEKNADVALDADGDFVVVWQGMDSDKEGIFFQRYNAAGVSQGGETTVNTTTTGGQKEPAVAIDSDGDFVVVWQGNGDQPGQVDDKGVFFQRFNSAGVAQGGETLVNTTTSNDEKAADVALDADGDFVVVWQGKDSDEEGVFFQRYNSVGVAQGGETLVNTTTSQGQNEPAIAMDSDGDFVVVWQGNGPGDADGVFGQQFDSAGAPDAGEFRVNTTTTNKQQTTAVTMDTNGDFVVVWDGEGTGDTDGVFLQRYHDTAPVLDLNGASAGFTFATAFTEDGGPVSITDPTATLTDEDSANLASLTVSITNLLDGTDEVLAADTSGTSISAAYNGALGILSLTGVDSVANYQQVLRTLTYDNASQSPNSTDRQIQFLANDGGKDGNVTLTTVTIAPVNDAPVLTPGTPTLSTINEDETANAGDLISAVVGASISDVDAGALEGVAITGLASGNGVWEYDTGGGWTAVGAVTDSSALLLRSTDSIRFVPDGQNADAASFTYRAWDQTSGSEGTKVDASANGGTTAFSTAADTAGITVTAVNDAATIANLATDSLAYSSGSGPLVIEQGMDALVADVDSADFDAGNLNVSIAAGGDAAEDVLSVRDQGAAPGQIGFDGVNVTYGGVLIGTAAGGSGGADLTITFNSNATTTAVSALVKNITYENTDTVSTTTGARTVRFTVDDGDGDVSANYDVTVSVSSNAPPTIANLTGDALAYSEGDGAQLIEQGGDALVDDLDSIDFDTGNLRVSIAAGGDAAEDVISIRDQGVAPGQIGFDGVNVTYGGVLIGTAAGGSGGVDLVVTFNTNATAIEVTALSKNITYENTDTDNPTTSARTVRFRLEDGDGGTSTNYDVTVTVTPLNDAPTTSNLAGDALAYNEGDGSVIIDQGAAASVADVDSANFDTGDLTVSIAAGGDATEDVLSIRNQGVLPGQIGFDGADVTYGGVLIGTAAGGSGGADLVVTLNANATTTAVAALAQNISYENTDVDDPTAGARTVRFTVNDGDGGVSLNYDATVTVTPLNDAPVINDQSFSINENTPDTTSVGTVAASDVDGPSLTYSITAGNTGAAFAINSSTGEITVANSAALDYETNPVFNLIVEVSDGGTPLETDSATVTINLNDVNEAAVGTISDGDGSADAVAENSLVGTTVGLTALATDADGTDTVSYSLDDDAGGLFAIDANSGVVTVAGALDAESATSQTITVRAASTDGSFSTRSFTIAISDINEFALGAVSDGDGAADSVSENSVNGTVVGVTAAANDADVTDGVTYSLDDDAGGRFAIDGNTGVVTVNGALDYEAAVSHNVTVRAVSTDGSFSTRVFTINLNDVDEFDVTAPADADAAINAVNENAANGTTVGLTAAAADADASTNAISYSLTDDAGGRFAIDSSSGVVTVADGTLLDREAAASHDVTVRATSADGSIADTTFTINVNDVDEFDVTAPADADAAINAVNENAANGATVGLTAAAADADASTNAISYSLTDDAGGRFAIDSSTGVVTVADGTLLDREAAASHDVTVRATSADGSIADTTFTINVNDVDEFDVTAPADADAATNAVDENAANGTTVGVTASAADADATTNAISYSLTDDAGGRFAIDSSTGVVTVANGTLLDREAAASHDVTVRATSADGSIADTTFTINVNDVDEFDVTAPADADAATNAVNENAANGTTVGVTASASDADATTNAISYSLTDDAGGRFAIDSSTGVVTVADGTLLDREAAASHDITVRATSADGSTADTTFTINVNDVDEFDVTAPADVDAATNAVNENSLVGTTVGLTAAATDEDGTDTVSYSLDDDAGGLFAIDANSGVVTVAGALDAESATSQTITVRAASTDGSFSTRSFTIAISDINEFALGAVSDGDGAADSVSENSVNGTAVGITAAANDADVTDAVTYSLDDAGGRFAIDGNTGVITVNGALDYEAAVSHNVTVRAISTDGSFSTRVFTIAVADANDNAPVITAAQTFGVAENAADGDSLGFVAAMDVDTAGSLQNWTITSGNADGIFAINAATGEITIADNTILDYETTSSYVLTLTVSDGLNPSAPQTVAINVSDVNEAPVVNDQMFSVGESAVNGSVVSRLVASDVDSGQTLTYSITGGTGATAFAIDSATGEITVADSSQLDFETTPSFTLTVQVSDNGAPNLSDTADVVIHLNDDNDLPIGAQETFSVDQFKTLTVLPAGVLENDFDQDGDSLSAVLVNGPVNGSLTLNPDGSFTYTPNVGFKGVDSFTYRPSDGNSEGDVTTVTIVVNEVTLPPPPDSNGGDGDSEDSSNKDNSDSESLDDDANSVDLENHADDAEAPNSPGATPSHRSVRVETGSISLFDAAAPSVEYASISPIGVDGIFLRSSGITRPETRTTGAGQAANSDNPDSNELVYLEDGMLWGELDAFKNGLDEYFGSNISVEKLIVGTTAVATTSLTVGYVMWGIRGGTLLASMLSALPAWTRFDPLPILDTFEEAKENRQRKEESNEETLVSMVTKDA